MKKKKSIKKLKKIGFSQVITWIFIFFLAVSLISYFVKPTEVNVKDWQTIVSKIVQKEKLNLSEFLDYYQQNKFEKIREINWITLKWYQTVSGATQQVNFYTMGGNTKIEYLKEYETQKPARVTLPELGISLSWAIPVEVKYDNWSALGRFVFETLLPILLFMWFFMFLLRWIGPKWGGGFPFLSSAWRLAKKDEVKTTFKNVAWMKESKEELKEIVDFLKNPKKYQKAWAKIPKWVLLYGPPGSGKTLLARAVAWEANVPFFSSSGAEFMEMLVGLGAAKVRDLFKKAKASAPSIIFIDEIDAIGKKRGLGVTWGHQEQEQTLNQILTEMDWFNQDTNVIVIAATNRPDILDPALLRPWRFDRKVFVSRPTLEERLEILKLHSQDKKLAKDVDLEALARRTSWFVWADLENILNEAALKAAKEWRDTINNADLEYALEKVVMGPEKKIKSMKEKERQTIAYHELGHAVTAYHLPNADPVEKISIVSRWRALGVTWYSPKEDEYLRSKAKFLDDLVSLLGWRAAEEIFLGKNEITTWAANDFERATKIATDMIMKYWMDEELGPIMYLDEDKGERQPFKPFSEKTAEKIDSKIKTLINQAYQKALNLIRKNKTKIQKLAQILLEKEYLTKEEFNTYMQDNKKLDEAIKQLQAKKKDPDESEPKDSKPQNKTANSKKRNSNSTNSTNSKKQNSSRSKSSK